MGRCLLLAAPFCLLVLGHFSNRYDADFIRDAIAREAAAAAIPFPIHAVLPLSTARDVLAQQPVWLGIDD